MHFNSFSAFQQESLRTISNAAIQSQMSCHFLLLQIQLTVQRIRARQLWNKCQRVSDGWESAKRNYHIFTHQFHIRSLKLIHSTQQCPKRNQMDLWFMNLWLIKAVCRNHFVNITNPKTMSVEKANMLQKCGQAETTAKGTLLTYRKILVFFLFMDISPILK